MASRLGTFLQTLNYQDLTQALRNRLPRATTAQVGPTPSGGCTGALSPFRTQARALRLYSGGVAVLTLYGTSWEYATSGSTFVATAFEAAPTLDAPGGMFIWLRHRSYDWGTGIIEKGNVAVVGLTSGDPDYMVAGAAIFTAGGAKTNAYNVARAATWDDRTGTWRVQRPQEATARNPRQAVFGRILVGRNDGSFGTLAVWIDNNGPTVPLSAVDTWAPAEAKNIQTDTGHLTYTGGAYNLPEAEPAGYALPGNPNYGLPQLTVTPAVSGVTHIELAFATDQRVGHLLATCAPYPAINPTPRWYFVQPPACERDLALATVPNKALIRVSSCDMARLQAHVVVGALGPAPIPVVWDSLDVFERDGLLHDLDQLRIDVAGELEPLGDNLSTF